MVTTTTLSKTLIVNPAFLQEIKDSNPDLWETVRRVRQVCKCQDAPSGTVKHLARLLDALRDHLALQFSVEESYGYMEVLDPPLLFVGELAARAQKQHCTLYLRLSELAEQAEELQYRGVEPAQLATLVQSALDFDAELRDHEQTENELIERLFDLG